jgi:hypothetical protein
MAPRKIAIFFHSELKCRKARISAFAIAGLAVKLVSCSGYARENPLRSCKEPARDEVQNEAAASNCSTSMYPVAGQRDLTPSRADKQPQKACEARNKSKSRTRNAQAQEAYTIACRTQDWPPGTRRESRGTPDSVCETSSSCKFARAVSISMPRPCSWLMDTRE